MKKTLRLGWLAVVEGILLILVGLLISILGGINSEELSKGLSLVIAIFLFIDGGLSILKSVFEAKRWFSPTLLIGAFAIALGVFLCKTEGQEFLPIALPIITGVALLGIGGGSFVKGIIQVAYKVTFKKCFVSFLIAAVGISLGVICLLFQNKSLPVIYIITGTAIVVLGVFEICFAITAMKQRKTITKSQKRDVIIIDDKDN